MLIFGALIIDHGELQPFTVDYVHINFMEVYGRMHY